MNDLKKTLNEAERAAVKRIFDGDEELIDNPEIFSKLYEYYLPEMPYGIAKARTGDPDVWIQERLEDDFDV